MSWWLKPTTHDTSLSADNVGCHFDVILSLVNVGLCVRGADIVICPNGSRRCWTTLSAMSANQQYRVVCQGCWHCQWQPMLLDNIVGHVGQPTMSGCVSGVLTLSFAQMTADVVGQHCRPCRPTNNVGLCVRGADIVICLNDSRRFWTTLSAMSANQQWRVVCSGHKILGFAAIVLGPIFLQCFDTIGWVIWPVKTCPWCDL